jgi:hypothetical protein
MIVKHNTILVFICYKLHVENAKYLIITVIYLFIL